MKLNWINTLPDGETTRKEFAFLPDKEGVENHVVNLYPEITFQTMEGFGGRSWLCIFVDEGRAEASADGNLFFAGADEVWDCPDSHGQL